ncbi:MAG: ABC transporter ATP-binding protein [Saccharothrix sp.]|nr:ABC transporter ATP-binding protein [Saccharothrix sp.]
MSRSPHGAPHAGAGPHASWSRRLLGYCLRHRADLVLAFGCALVAAVATAALPLVLRHVVDEVAAGAVADVTPWVGVFLAVAAVRFAAGYVRRYRSGTLSLGVQQDLRDDAFKSLLRLDGSAQDDLRTGQVVSRSISDITLIQTLLGFLPNITGNVLMFLGSVVVMAVLSPPLTLVALAVGPALWFIARHSRRDLFPANWHTQEKAAEVAATVEAAVTGVRVVKGFGQEEREQAALEDRAAELYASRLRVTRLSSRYNPAMQAVPALGQVLVLAFGGWLALRGEITLGTFLAFTTYLGAFVNPVRQLATLLTVAQQARAGVERVLEIIDAEPAFPDGTRDLPPGPLDVEFSAVAFSYPGVSVVDSLSLRIACGETLALVGPAGSGKSTLGSLLPRFYDVSAGAVRVGGVDVREVRAASLRAAVGVVFEETYLLSDSVHANIAYGRPTATRDEVVAAARSACADEFITDLPQGYDTVIGEQGLTLSGGQRQRIALARALLYDPRVLVLDDATSAIDARVEAEIHRNLASLRRTTLVVAHRRSTLALADRIAVLDGGTIVDVGSEAELDARCPAFHTLMSGPDFVGTPWDNGTGGRRPAATLTTPADHTAAARHTIPAGRATPATPRGPAVAVPVGGPWENGSGGRRPQAAHRVAQAFAAQASGAPGPGAIGGGVLASAPPDPDLLARLAPLDEKPTVDRERARAADPRFGLARLLRPFRWSLVAGLVLVALDAAAQIALPVLVRAGVDGHVVIASLVAAVVVLGGWGIGVAQVRVTGRTGERLLYTLRVKTFAQLQRLGLDFYERELGGRIMTRMTTDVDALSNFLQTGLATAFVTVLTIFGVLVAMVAVDPPLAVVLLVLLPVLLGATVLFRRRSVPAYVEARERISVVNAYLQETVASLRASQAFRREDTDAAEFTRRGDAFRVARLRAQRNIALYFPFVEFLSAVASAGVVAVGAGQVRDGVLTAGTLIAFLLYVDMFFAPVQQLPQVFDGYQQAVIGLSRLRGLMRTPTSTPPADAPLPVTRLRGEIVFEDVHFSYTGRGEALRGVSLRVAAGETVALVGRTGAGKSTVVKLVARFHDPTGGAVLVDGVDLRSLDLTGYRRRLGVVPQEAHLFGGTVRDAIAYGRPDATDEQVEAAARAVGAHDVVARLPLGYHQPVGERGRGLSAGQRQLIALARAELVDPDVLLLDEATAALDLATEHAVTRAVEAVSRRRTTLVVAHRLTTAARADRVVVLDGGRIAEVGTHAELLDRAGPYRLLWDAFTAPGDRPGSVVSRHVRRYRDETPVTDRPPAHR